MQGYHEVSAAVPAPSDAHISDDADYAAALYQDAVAMLPDLVELVKKRTVVRYVAKLVWVVIVLL